LPAPGPPWPWPTAIGPPSEPPPPFSGRPEAGVSGPPFPLVIDRLRTALTPRSFRGYLDLHRATNGRAAHHRHLTSPFTLQQRSPSHEVDRAAEATLTASVTKRVGTYNHQLACLHRAFTGNHPELWQRSAHPLRRRHSGATPCSQTSSLLTSVVPVIQERRCDARRSVSPPRGLRWAGPRPRGESGG